jgi:lipopolysaccharide/colanic/teichoic acid biosynthesis glycosyltransferase
MPTIHFNSLPSPSTGKTPQPNPSQTEHMTAIYLLGKIALDYLLTVPTVLLLSPLYLFIAILIKLDSPGPVFCRRRVLGLNGREFNAFKFRTTSIGNDMQPTRTGRLLRLYRLDDLPQLFNILRRDMSIIGPRIITPPEAAMYGRYRQTRLAVYPGLTGLWQICATQATREERIYLDLTYIRQWSLWLDLKILLLTIPAVFRG